jgi:DNA-binding transcriptional LysR family regulator
MQFSAVDLRLFVAVAELLSLTRAAQRCHLSLPAVSNRIHAMERQAGCRLLERQPRGVRLTSAGETFARHARAMLLEADSLQSALRDFTDGMGDHLTILANTTAVIEFMPTVLAGFLAAHPHVTVSLKEQGSHEVARAVREGRADLGVVAGDLDLTGFASVHFATDRLVLVAAGSHPLACRARVRLAEVIEHPMVGLYEGSTAQTFLAGRVEAMGRPPLLVRVQVNSFEALCQMAEAGVGLAIAPESVARHYARTMRIAVVALADTWAIRERYLITRAEARTPATLRDLIVRIRAHHGTRGRLQIAAPALAEPATAT